MGKSTGDFQVLQLIALVVFAALDWSIASFMLVPFLEIYFEMTVGL